MRISNRGFTLIEMLIIVMIIGVLTALIAPRVGDTLEKQRARSAGDAVVVMHAKTRAIAVRRGLPAALIRSGNTLYTVSIHPVTEAIDTVGVIEDLGDRYGVTLTASRDTLVFDARGLGTESGSTTIIVSNAGAADTVRINRERTLAIIELSDSQARRGQVRHGQRGI